MDSVASSVTARLAVPSLRLATRTPGRETAHSLGELGHAHARLADAEWGTRSPHGAVAWGSERSPPSEN